MSSKTAWCAARAVGPLELPTRKHRSSREVGSQTDEQASYAPIVNEQLRAAPMNLPDPFVDDTVWGAFRATCVAITIGDRRYTVTPTPIDQRGDFLPDVVGPLHMVTAWNPNGIAAAIDENHRRNTLLLADLTATHTDAIWPTVGFDPTSDWHEDGFSVAGLTRDAAIALAVRYEQRAIFEWSNQPGGFRLIACDHSANEPRGWTLQVVRIPSASP